MKPVSAYSWPWDEKIKQEIGRQLEALKEEHGIDEVKIGFEVEFRLPEEPQPLMAVGAPPQQNNHWREKQAEFLEALSADPVRNAQEIAAISSFNARETLMYDLLHDPATREMLRPLKPELYYDAPNVLEVQITECSPPEALKRYEACIEKLYEKAHRYSLAGIIEDTGAPKVHLNISFWKDGQNLSDASAQHPETAQLLKGIARVLHDTIVTICNDDPAARVNRLRQPRTSATTVGLSRNDTVRMKGFGKDSRFETGFGNPMNHRHVALSLSHLLSGATFALDPKNADYDDHLLDATPCHRLHGTGKESLYFADMVNGGHLDMQGGFHPPEKYIRNHALEIATELGWIKSQDWQGIINRPKQKLELEKKAIAFFKALKFEAAGEDRVHVVFPSNSGLSPQQQAEILAGLGEVTKTPSLHIEPGYPNALKAGATPEVIAGERVWRAMDSEILRRTMSPELHEELTHPDYGALSTLCVPGEAAKAVVEEREAEIVRSKQQASHELIGAGRGYGRG